MKNIIKCDNCGTYSDETSKTPLGRWVEYSLVFVANIDKQEKHFCSNVCLSEYIERSKK